MRLVRVVVVPPVQSSGLVDRKDLHVETTWAPQSTLWHLNRAGNDIVASRTLPEIEKMIARVRAAALNPPASLPAW
jgi:hypothetical protein